jgi:hypothetical protein
MPGEVANYAVVGLISIIAVYLLLHNRDRIRLFFASASQRLVMLEQARLTQQKNAAGMDEYERQVIIDILKDQLEHSREANSAFERDFEKLITRIETFEARMITKIEALEVKAGGLQNGLGQINNRLDMYRLLLTKNEDTRK